MKRFILVGILLILIGIGCTAQPEAGVVTGYEDLIARLEEAGLDVEAMGEITQPFFDVSGRLIQVAGQEIQVFEYADAEAAAAAAAEIAPDAGTIGESAITWISDPHIYRAGRLLVVYVGQNEQVINALQAVLGAQIAGR